MSPDYAAQLAALVELSVAYWGARNLTWGVLWRAFGDPLPPLSECIWPPPGITEQEANSRLLSVQHFRKQCGSKRIQGVIRDISKAQVGLVASGFDPPDSWIIANPLEDFKGGEMGLCGVREIVQSAPAEHAAFEKVWKEIDVALIRLRGKIAGSTPPPAETEPREGNGGKGKRKGKKSTAKGEGRLKLIAALTKHHKYADGGCPSLEPIGNNALARLAEVEGSTASAFFSKEFKGHTKYRAVCGNATQLVAALKLLNQEFSPHHLYGAKPPGKDEREDEE